MAPADFNIIDVYLRDYTAAISSGFGLIRGDVTSVFSILIVITIGITAVFWAIDENNAVLPALFRKILLVGFFVWVVNDWQGLTSTVIRGFVQLGLKAGASSMNPDTFMQSPGNLVVMGWHHVQRFIEIIDEKTGPVAFFENIAAIICLAVAAVGTMAAFFILSIQLFVTIIEFRLVTLAAFVLVPFGILKQTSFLSERAFGYVVAAGLKLLTIAIIVSIGAKTFEAIPLADPAADVIAQALAITFASVVLMMLALTVPSLAAALVTGGPQLGAGAALAGTAGVAAAAGGAYLAGRAAIAAPGAIAARAKAAAGAIGGGSTAPSGGGGTGEGPAGSGMQPANPPSSGGNATESGAGAAPRASKAAAGTPRQGNAPSDNGSTDRVAPAAEPSTSAVPAVSSRSAANDESTANAAPSSAPPASETVRRAEARRRIVTPTSHAQAAMAATSAQGGAGMTATIEHDEE